MATSAEVGVRSDCPACGGADTRKATVYWQCLGCGHEWLGAAPGVRLHTYAGEPPAKRAPLLPYNRFEVAVFVGGRATAERWETLCAPAHVDDAVARAQELASWCREQGLDVRGAQALGKYTADGRYCWSGKPLGERTVGHAEWLECVAACRAADESIGILGTWRDDA